MIDAIVVYILILVKLTLTSLKITQVQESKDFCANYLTKFPIDLNGILNTEWTCWCGECQTHFISNIFNIQGKEPGFCDFANRNNNKTLTMSWFHDRDHETIHVEISSNDLDLHSASRLYRQSNISVSFFSQIYGIDLDVATSCSFVEAHAKFIMHKLYSRERTVLT